ncbi:hypothetical protein BDZ45DRAFT_606804, partial [Acephala macrosclerotiorum]
DTKVNVKNLGRGHMRDKIEHWFSLTDSSTNHNKALTQRQKGSGLWFLHNDAFTRWKEQTGSFLWVRGIPGCGKLILSSAIMEY